jgi:hypothetical protein
MNSKSESKYRMKDGVVVVNDCPKCKTMTDYLFHHMNKYLYQYVEYRQKTANDEKMIDKHCRKAMLFSGFGIQQDGDKYAWFGIVLMAGISLLIWIVKNKKSFK